MDAQEEPKADLVHVHQCSSCKRYNSPEEFSARDNITGLYECPFCHISEALNVQIVPRSSVERQS